MKNKGNKEKVDLDAASQQSAQDVIPRMAGGETIASVTGNTRTRRNKSALIERTHKYKNIEDGLVPFKYTKGVSNSSNLDVRDAVVLCQKAYYNYSVFRNTIDLMTEFSSSDIFFTGGTKKSREFFEHYFRKINIWDLQDKFFREYYRSGNVFIYRFESTLQKEDIVKMKRAFKTSMAQSVELPSRYIILNPADIQMGGSISFAHGKYYKILSDYELEKLRDPRTEEDKQVLKSLDSESRDLIKNSKNATILLPLDVDKIVAVFYKKQDYEPFAVPMGYPVLEDINWKAELKKMDMAITRTMQQAILLVTMGAEPDKGGVNQKNLEAMQVLFQNESVGRVLISDYTTDAKFVIPDIASLLDPKKYEIVDRDIAMGLNNVLMGSGEKFANQSSKTEVFLARLRQARQSFLNEFLMPEIKRISKAMGFRVHPSANFHKISLSDDTLVSRIYARLMEVGILTPEEGFEALESGRLPNDKDLSVESQTEWKKHKDAGLYEPVVGGPNTQKEIADKQGDLQLEMQDKTLKQQDKDLKQQNKQGVKTVKPKSNQPVGRPSGTGSPQDKPRTTTPIGQKKVSAQEETKYSLSKVTDNLVLAQKLLKIVEAKLRETHKIKRLSNKQKEVAKGIVSVIIANEESCNWEKRVPSYVKKPVDTNPNRAQEVEDIACEHQIDCYLASILLASKKT